MSELEKARIEVMKAVVYVQKTGKHGQGYSYASEADLIRVLRAAMVTNGLTICPVDVQVTDHHEAGKQRVTEAVITYAMRHVSGEEQRIAVLSSGADVGDKAAFKAMTGAEKYALRQAFLIPTGDDPEAEQVTPPRGLTADEQDAITKRVDGAGNQKDLMTIWDDYQLNEANDATDEQDAAVRGYFTQRRAALKGAQNA